MIGKELFSGGSEKTALELRWRTCTCRVADCSWGGFHSPKTHDRRKWTAMYDVRQI